MPCCLRHTSSSGLLLIPVLGLLLLVTGAPAAAGGQTPSTTFAGFESAWAARSEKQVVNLLGPKGTFRIRVLAPRLVDASWTPAQAKKGLGSYFGKHGVTSVRLKDITPPHRGQRTVRLYDYTYRPHGMDVRTTRLTVTLRQDAHKRWVLASVIESARPRPRRSA